MIILEQFSELDILLKAAAELGVAPVLGVRAKLTTRHAGHWGSTSGDRAKFGLRPAEIMAVVDVLSARGMLGCLKLLHFHAGSQVQYLSLVLDCHQQMTLEALLDKACTSQPDNAISEQDPATESLYAQHFILHSSVCNAI